MKKIYYFLFSVFVALSLILPCMADEVSTDIVTEIVTETVTETVTPPTEETESEPATEVLPDSMNEEDVESYWETFKDKISDSATWTMIGTALATVLSLVVAVKKTFDKITALIHNKADNETLKESIKGVETDLRAAFDETYAKMAKTMKRYEDSLQNTADNEQKLYAVLSLFMLNCKISESAKGEILGILGGVKKYSGELEEVVAKAQEAIDKEREEQANLAPATPTLDKLLEEDYMELG